MLTTQGYALLTLVVAVWSVVPRTASGARGWDTDRVALAIVWLALGAVILVRRMKTDGRRPVTFTLAACAMGIACVAGLRAAL